MSGRANYRKTKAADAFWERLRTRVNELPPDAPAGRFVIYDFVTIEGGGVIATFNVRVRRWRLTIGRCLWRYRPDRSDYIELPACVGMSDPSDRARFLGEIRAAVLAYARNRSSQEKE